MFINNREFRIKMVKNKKDKNDDAVTDDSRMQEFAHFNEEAGKELLRRVAVTVVATVAVIKVVDTLCEIAVKKTKSGDQE